MTPYLTDSTTKITNQNTQRYVEHNETITRRRRRRDPTTRQANANISDPRSRAGYSRQGFFGFSYPPAYLSTNASRLEYEILTLFSTNFEASVIPFDERPLVAMNWSQALKRQLAPLNEISADQMLVFIYKLLQGSADIATLGLSQRRDMTDEIFLNFFEDGCC